MSTKNEHGLSTRSEAFAQRIAAGEERAAAYAAVFGHGKKNEVTLKEMACKYAAKPEIRARVIEIQTAGAEMAAVTASKVIDEIAKIAFSDVSHIFSGDSAKLPSEIDDRTRAAIAGIKITAFGVEYKFWDKNAALEKLARHLGLFEKDNNQKPAPLVGVVQLVPLQPPS